MRKLNFRGFIELRDEAYKAAGVVGDAAERFRGYPVLDVAYARMCEGLDAIDDLGVQLGYLDDETNEVLEESK
jgi:hypothetical protein